VNGYQKFNDEREPNGRKKYNITVKEEPDKWYVFFNPKGPIYVIGDHALVIVSKETDEVKYHPGM
jgi:hypothetical protein